MGEQVQQGTDLAHSHEQQASGRAGARTQAPLLLPFSYTDLWKGLGEELFCFFLNYT